MNRQPTQASATKGTRPPDNSSLYQWGWSQGADWRRAIEQTAAARGDATPCSLVLFFVGRELVSDMAEIALALVQQFGTYSVLGCSAESLVAGPDEFEQTSGLAIWTATWPDASVALMHLRFQHTPDGPQLSGWPTNWPDTFSAEADTLLVLGEPFSFPAEHLLEFVAAEQAPLRVVGGMASGGTGPGENALAIAGEMVREGAVAALIQGVKSSTVVSQGCRPIGETMIVTQAERNVIYQLSGRPALVRLKELFNELPNHEKELVQQGLHLGRVVTEFKDAFEHGDFLIRNVVGIHPPDGSIVLGDFVRVGQTVRFHLRDQQTAHDDLQQLLEKHQSTADASPGGALLFTCNGRGSRLFDVPSHDARLLSQVYPNLAVAGFFAQGEIGPLGQRSFLHGFTASIVLFE
jgi:small ligand-binding sensory domain FIST